MRLLVTGRGKSGSWRIRGDQLGRAIGADVVPNVGAGIEKYDAMIVVKRPRPEAVQAAQRARVPIVWDVVDAWPQPEGNEWSREASLAWMRSMIESMRPAGLVAATRKMAADCEAFNVPVVYLPHHARPEQPLNPVEQEVRVVGYEGGFNYLGRWNDVLARSCTRRGWRFDPAPLRLADVDIVVAMRDANGYAARNWKSNVKLANAQGSGTPCVMNREAGYLETERGGVEWADTPQELEEVFDRLSSHDVRRRNAEMLRQSAPQLIDISMEYLTWLRQSKF